MKGFKDSCDTMLRAWVRGVSGVGVVCGVIAMLVLVTGCPFLLPPPLGCPDDGCDDGVFCNGAETCVDDACVAGEAAFAEGEFCNDEDGRCATGGTGDQDECAEGDECGAGTGAARRATMGAMLGTTKIQTIHTSSDINSAAAARCVAVEIIRPRLKKVEM